MPVSTSLIDQCTYLYLTEISEPRDNILRLVVAEAKPQGEPDARGAGIDGIIGRPVRTDSTCSVFEIYWPSYSAYSVRNESFTSRDDYEKFAGKTFRLYTKLRFLDYIGFSAMAYFSGMPG